MSNTEHELNRPRVLLGSAVHESKEYILDEFLDSVKQLDYKPLDIYLCDNSRTDKYSKKITKAAKDKNIDIDVERDAWCSDFRGRMVTSHNKLREKAIKGNYDYMLILDQDILVRPDVPDRMLKHKKKVVSGVYKLDMGEIGWVNSCWKRRKKLKNGRLRPIWISDDELNKGLVEWPGGIPTGLLLLHRSVLEDTAFRHAGFLQDSVFWKDVRDAGYKIYVDTDLLAHHNPSRWDKLVMHDIKELGKHRPDDNIKAEDRFYFTPLIPKKW